jgi:dolichol-phosphate mannosyltransferase
MTGQKKIKALIGTAAWNEGEKIALQTEHVLAFIKNRPPDERVEYSYLLVDDGSTDGMPEKLAALPGVKIIRHEKTLGAGTSVREIYREAQAQGCEIAVTIAGNAKDDPAEIPRLIQPILEDGFDFVQGSRYLAPEPFGYMPLYRLFATKYLHPLLFSFFSRKRITDSTNGFRAIRVSLLEDKRIDLKQAWLDRYELEPYIFFKAIRLGFSVCEVPVRKVYPSKVSGYTKMVPIVDWWRILKPLFYLGLGLKK